MKLLNKKIIIVVILFVPSMFFGWKGTYQYIQYRKLTVERENIQYKIDKPLSSSKVITKPKDVMEIIKATPSVKSIGLITLVDNSTIPAKAIKKLKLSEIGSIRDDETLDIVLSSSDAVDTMYYLSKQFLYYQYIEVIDQGSYKSIEIRVLVKGE